MPRVELPVVRALVKARVGEIAWSPFDQLALLAVSTFAATSGAVSFAITPDVSRPAVYTWIFALIAFQLGMFVGKTASPTGGWTVWDPYTTPVFGHVMAHLPATALERLLATSVLAVPMAVPYVGITTLCLLSRHFSAPTATLFVSLVVLGFAAQRTSTQYSKGAVSRWARRRSWTVPVYGSPGGGEVRAAFWSLAAPSVWGIFMAPGCLLLMVVCMPIGPSFLGAQRGMLALAWLASFGMLYAPISYAVYLPTFATVPLSKRSIGLAVSLVLLSVAVASGACALPFGVLYYRTSEGLVDALRLLMTLTAFQSLAVAVFVRFGSAKTLVLLGVLLLFPLMPATFGVGLVAAFFPALMPAVSVLALIAFVLALAVALTSPRDPLSRRPGGLIGALLLRIGDT